MRNYIIRTDSNLLYCFYNAKDKGILYRTYEGNKWSGAKTVSANTREIFSVNISHNGKIHIFCQDVVGNVVLCQMQDGKFGNRIILKASDSEAYDIFFNALIMEKEMLLLYNMPSLDDKNFYLMSQRLNENGQWSQANRIDKFSPGSDTIYQIQHISKDHVLLFYQMKIMENISGYREITPDRQGNFNSYYSGAATIYDQSVLTTNTTVHVAYAVKGLFSSQLIYRKKDDINFTRQIIIWESQRIDTVCLYIVKNNLYLAFKSNDILYTCISENNGATFSRPLKYANKFCLSPEKAFYISGSPQSESEYFLRDIYVDSLHPWDVQMLPDLYENFYPYQVTAPVNIQAPPEQGSAELVEILRMQLADCKKTLAEKDKQIEYLNTMLKQRNDELIRVRSDSIKREFDTKK